MPSRPVWEGLSGPAGRGEVATELDPATVLILLFSAALAPVSMPHIIEHISGAPADSPEFLQRYVDQLSQIVRHLRA